MHIGTTRLQPFLIILFLNIEWWICNHDFFLIEFFFFLIEKIETSEKSWMYIRACPKREKLAEEKKLVAYLMCRLTIFHVHCVRIWGVAAVFSLPFCWDFFTQCCFFFHPFNMCLKCRKQTLFHRRSSNVTNLVVVFNRVEM